MVFFILITLIIALNLLKQISDTLKSSERLSLMVDDIQKLEIKNKELKKKLTEIKSQEFVEEQARNKLGLVKAGEIVVIIAQDRIKQILGVSSSAQQVRLPNWQGWLKLFWH